jgi:hypothetical protein
MLSPLTILSLDQGKIYRPEPVLPEPEADSAAKWPSRRARRQLPGAAWRVGWMNQAGSPSGTGA